MAPLFCKRSGLARRAGRDPKSGERVVGLGRLELPTLRLSGVRSNHLSYRPMTAFVASAPGSRLHPDLVRPECVERETKTAAIRSLWCVKRTVSGASIVP